MMPIQNNENLRPEPFRLLRAFTVIVTLSTIAACGTEGVPAGEDGDGGGATTFAKSFGGDFNDVPSAAIELSDGGYAFAGVKSASEPDSFDRGAPPWVVRLDSIGNVVWQRTLNEAGGVGGSLNRNVQGIKIRAVPSGGYCIAGTVIGAPGDAGDIYVGLLDDQRNLVWESSFDSGGWNGYSIIPAADRAAYALDRVMDVTYGPNDSCYVAAASYAHLRDTLGVGISSDDNSVLIDPGGSFLNATSLVVARVGSGGPSWIRRDTSGAFNGELSVINGILGRSDLWVRADSANLAIATTDTGGLVTVRHVRTQLDSADNLATGLQARPGKLRSMVWDAAGTTRIVRDDFNDLRVRNVAVVADGDGMAVGAELDNGELLYRIDASGDRDWTQRDFMLTNDYSRLNGLTRVCNFDCWIVAFGQDADGGYISWHDEDDGAIDRTVAGTDLGPIVAMSRTVNGRALGAVDAVREDSPGQLVDFDLTQTDLVLSTADRELRGSSIELEPSRAYAVSGSTLQVQIPDSPVNSYALTPSVANPIGLAELDGGRIAVALRRSGLEDSDVVVVLEDGNVVAETEYLLESGPAKIAAVAPRQAGGAFLLMRYTRDGSPASSPAYSIISIGADGSFQSRSDSWIAYDRDYDPVVKENPAGGAVALHPSFEFGGSLIVRVAPNGSIVSADNFGEAMLDLDVAEDGGLVVLAASLRPYTILRLDADNALLWKRRYQVSGMLWITPVVDTNPEGRIVFAPDGSITVTTSTRQLVGSGLAGSNGSEFFGEHNVGIFRVSATGDVLKSTVHGALYNEHMLALAGLRDGGYLVAASSDSLGQPRTDAEALSTEAWLLRTGPDGLVSESCNALLTELPESVFAVTDVGLATAFSSGGGLPGVRPATQVIDFAPRFTTQESPIVVARQCVGTAATETGTAPPTNLQRLTVTQAGSIPGLVTSTPTGIFCGGADPQACERDFANGSTAFLTVDDSSASEFRGWGDGCTAITTSPNRCEVLMDQDRDIAAFFEPWDGSTASLTVDVTGAGRVWATQPVGIDCIDDPSASDCSEVYRLGQRVDLTLAEEPGETFQGWGGDCAEWATSNTIRVTVDADKTCTAQFTGVGTPPRYRLDTLIVVDGIVKNPGEPGGEIISSPAGADCGGFGQDCSEIYDGGSTARLLARATTGYQFIGWTSNEPMGPCTDIAASTIDVLMNQDIDCTANFETFNAAVSILTVQLELDGTLVGASGPYGGNVTTSPAGIDCGSQSTDCEEGYLTGEVVSLFANADPGYSFVAFSGDCSGSVSGTAIAMNGDQNCVVSFATTGVPTQPSLTVTINGNGRVDSNPAGISCGLDCSSTFALGTSVTLAAAGTFAEPFTGWSGDCSGNGTFAAVTMDTDKHCIADFAPQTGTNRLTITVIGNGNVTTEDGRVDCPGDCVEDYTTGARARILAAPDSGSTFQGWSGDCMDLGTATDFFLTMNRDWTCTATFSP
ncbi:MAG: hypothetical protein QNI99_11375 [Woeseiaceae bacterium]|nr:hypothetical protein [Woeseiaceae bacterium]